VNCRAGGRLREHGVDIAKIFLEFAELARVDARLGVVYGESELWFFLS